MNKLIAGIDLGGTKVAVGLITRDGEILSRQKKAPSRAKTTYENVLNIIAGTVQECVAENGYTMDDISAAGIGSPGPIDLQKGIILNPQNLPALNNQPLRDDLQKLFNVPVHLNNDATCFVLGEAIFGAGKGSRIVCGITLGTGTGCGLVIDGKPYDGATGTSTEIWKSPYKDLTVEDYTSGKGIRMQYKNRTGKELYAKEIGDLGFAGDPVALEAWNEYGMHLGKILAGLINFIDPDVFVLGGSVAKSFELFKEPMFTELYRHIHDFPKNHIKVLPYQLGDHSGFAGAAALAL